MPTVLRVGRYRFFFYSNEGIEPPHIHVEAGGDEAKYWLDPIRLQDAHDFSARDRRAIERIINNHRDELMRAWNDYFNP
jgi:hypothetical protein